MRNYTEVSDIMHNLHRFYRWFVILVIAVQPFYCGAQDAIFSQFYSNPLYLNPALAGTGECSRLILNYRNQWPSLPANFTTFSASADHYVEALSGGIGLLINSDNAGGGAINTLKISGIYAYHLKLSENASLNAGFEATYYRQQLKWDKLIFPDMIDPVSGNINIAGTGEKPPDNTTVSVPDFSTGLLLGIGEKYYFGIAADHLAEPDLKYYNNTRNPLYRKFTVHGGARFNLGSSYQPQSSDFILSPNILFQHQQDANQLDFGLYVEKSPLVVGTWFRHNFKNPDGLVFLIGITQKRFKFGYSYDLTLSKLKGSTGGAHEVSLALLVNCYKKRNKPGAIKCPEF